MPSIVRRPGRPTVYLDTSGLSYAFRGAHPAHRKYALDPQFEDLGALVATVAATGNLCVSPIHIIEIARNGDEASALAMIDWLDSLDTVWLQWFHTIRQDEEQRALQLALGVTPRTDVEVFVPNLLRAFESLDIDQVTEALRRGQPLHSLYESARAYRGDREEQWMAGVIQTFHFDRFEDPSTRKLTPDEKKTIVAKKLRATLVQEAREAQQRLRFETVPEFHEAAREAEDVTGRYADFVLANPTELPSWLLSNTYSSRWGDAVAGKSPGSNSFRDEAASGFYDHAHLAGGGAYCDVFTCDQRTARAIAGARERLGLAPPIVFAANDAAGFTRAIAGAAGV